MEPKEAPRRMATCPKLSAWRMGAGAVFTLAGRHSFAVLGVWKLYDMITAIGRFGYHVRETMISLVRLIWLLHVRRVLQSFFTIQNRLLDFNRPLW